MNDAPLRVLELKVPPVVVAVSAAGLMWLVSSATPSFRFSFPGRPVFAAALVLAGIAIDAFGIAAFRRARTTLNPTQPNSTSSLVVTGIYRATRNPMYLGFALLLCGWGVWLAHPLSLVVIAGFIVYLNRFQIVPEERALRSRFGDAYEAYQTRARRWV